jgi:integrase
MGVDRKVKRERCVLQGLERFCHLEGLGSPSLFAGEVTEAFVAHGLDDRAPSTKGTYRSVLRELAGLPRPGRAPGYRGSMAAPPYSPSERTELSFVARAQRKTWRRHSALVLLALGIGAGLRTSEIVAVTGDDVVCSRRAVLVRVGGTQAREVPVRGSEAGVLRALASGAGSSYLFHPEQADRRAANFVNDFCAGLTADPAAARLSVGRCRSSYICGHLAGGTELSVLLGLTGIREVESLWRYAAHVEGAPASKAALRQMLRAETT